MADVAGTGVMTDRRPAGGLYLVTIKWYWDIDPELGQDEWRVFRVNNDLRSVDGKVLRHRSDDRAFPVSGGVAAGGYVVGVGGGGASNAVGWFRTGLSAYRKYWAAPSSETHFYEWGEVSGRNFYTITAPPPRLVRWTLDNFGDPDDPDARRPDGRTDFLNATKHDHVAVVLPVPAGFSWTYRSSGLTPDGSQVVYGLYKFGPGVSTGVAWASVNDGSLQRFVEYPHPAGSRFMGLAVLGDGRVVMQLRNPISSSAWSKLVVFGAQGQLVDEIDLTIDGVPRWGGQQGGLVASGGSVWFVDHTVYTGGYTHMVRVDVTARTKVRLPVAQAHSEAGFAMGIIGGAALRDPIKAGAFADRQIEFDPARRGPRL